MTFLSPTNKHGYASVWLKLDLIRCYVYTKWTRNWKTRGTAIILKAVTLKITAGQVISLALNSFWIHINDSMFVMSDTDCWCNPRKLTISLRAKEYLRWHSGSFIAWVPKVIVLCLIPAKSFSLTLHHYFVMVPLFRKIFSLSLIVFMFNYSCKCNMTQEKKEKKTNPYLL